MSFPNEHIDVPDLIEIDGDEDDDDAYSRLMNYGDVTNDETSVDNFSDSDDSWHDSLCEARLSEGTNFCDETHCCDSIGKREEHLSDQFAFNRLRNPENTWYDSSNRYENTRCIGSGRSTNERRTSSRSVNEHRDSSRWANERRDETNYNNFSCQQSRKTRDETWQYLPSPDSLSRGKGKHCYDVSDSYSTGNNYSYPETNEIREWNRNDVTKGCDLCSNQNKTHQNYGCTCSTCNCKACLQSKNKESIKFHRQRVHQKRSPKDQHQFCSSSTDDLALARLDEYPIQQHQEMIQDLADLDDSFLDKVRVLYRNKK